MNISVKKTVEECFAITIKNPILFLKVFFVYLISTLFLKSINLIWPFQHVSEVFFIRLNLNYFLTVFKNSNKLEFPSIILIAFVNSIVVGIIFRKYFDLKANGFWGICFSEKEKLVFTYSLVFIITLYLFKFLANSLIIFSGMVVPPIAGLTILFSYFLLLYIQARLFLGFATCFLDEKFDFKELIKSKNKEVFPCILVIVSIGFILFLFSLILMGFGEFLTSNGPYSKHKFSDLMKNEFFKNVKFISFDAFVIIIITALKNSIFAMFYYISVANAYKQTQLQFLKYK